mmetsp:Transcript_85/g.307  ORF Transcript_85/g.307 Transcript_85/m.307 type:complete len:219 (-) Transcript_85:537-1193(-)
MKRCRRSMCMRLSLRLARTVTAMEAASECVLSRSRMTPATQSSHPSIPCAGGTGGNSSTRRPSRPIVKATSPSGSGAGAKYLLLMCTPNATVAIEPHVIAPREIQPMGRPMNGSRILSQAIQSLLLEGISQEISRSRVAGTAAQRSAESVTMLRPKGTEPVTVRRTSEVTNQRTTDPTKRSARVAPMPLCIARDSRNGRQFQTSTRPAIRRAKTRGSQ